jgi:glycosyltransferase involved in cell wall biosynthesis
MRILFVTHQFMPEFAAGTERVTLNLAKAAQASGHQVDVLTCSVQGGERWSGKDDQGLRTHVVEAVPVHAIPGDDSANLVYLGFESSPVLARRVERYLDGRAPYDVVHVTHSMRMLDAIEVIQRRGIPYILTLTDFYLLCYRTNLVQLSGALCSGPAGGSECGRHCRAGAQDQVRLAARHDRMREILARAASINACSEYVAGLFRREHPDLPVRVIAHGIDLLQFDPSSWRPRGDELVFGYVGTLSEAKGVRVLVDAFIKAAPPNARLELVGPIHDQALALELSRKTDGNARITIHSPVPSREIPETMRRFDLLCLPSLVPESFSLVLHEAFAAGIPCIVSDLGSPARVVREARCGATVARGDVRAWSEMIVRIAANPTRIDDWKENLPLPRRVEEEGFLYSRAYREVGEVVLRS